MVAVFFELEVGAAAPNEFYLRLTEPTAARHCRPVVDVCNVDSRRTRRADSPFSGAPSATLVAI